MYVCVCIYIYMYLVCMCVCVYIYIVCVCSYVYISIDKIKENCFKLRSRRHLAKTITDTDYADDIALLTSAPAQAETLLHSLEQTNAGISTQFKCKYSLILKNISISSYSV